jgi:hypothetical protein
MQTVEEAAKELSTATDSLVDGIGRLTDADARGPSLLPGWTRGHVLTHLARNADGGTPAARLGHVCQLGGDTADAVRISGTEADLLAWVLGRSDGNGLARDKPGPLPSMPSIYYA